jgi:hypothetical protein
MQGENSCSTDAITCGQAQYGGVLLPFRFIVLYSQRGEEEEEIPNRQDLRGTPVSIAEQIYLLCGQQPPHRFLASILVPLFLKYWLTPGLESYLTNESMYGRKEREEEGRSLLGVSRPVNFPAPRRATQSTHTLLAISRTSVPLIASASGSHR